jgi:sporulation-control protein
MAFFNKVLASVGIGAAKVDTKLASGQFTAGQQLTGVVEITGGNVAQEIGEIYVSLLTTFVKEANDKKYIDTGVIEKYRVSEKLTIQPNEVKEIPLNIILPIDMPITAGKTKVWLQTGLDIKNAVDPSDKDFINILPLKLIQEVLDAVKDLGFHLREVECEAASRKNRVRFPFVQEFEFVPRNGIFRGKLDELELVFSPKSETAVDVFMQIDRRARGLGSFLAEAMEMDETSVRIAITTADLPILRNQLVEVIQRYT